MSEGAGVNHLDQAICSPVLGDRGGLLDAGVTAGAVTCSDFWGITPIQVRGASPGRCTAGCERARLHLVPFIFFVLCFVFFLSQNTLK